MKRYGLRSTGETDTHDYFDKVLSRKGAAPATGRDTLIQLQGRDVRQLDTHASENRLAGLPPRITRITCALTCRFQKFLLSNDVRLLHSAHATAHAPPRHTPRHSAQATAHTPRP